MASSAALRRDARKNLRQAERNLRSIESELRANAEILRTNRRLIQLANDELKACSDASRRAELIDILAGANDTLRGLEQATADFQHLQRAARTAVDRAHLVLRALPSPAGPEIATPSEPTTPSS